MSSIPTSINDLVAARSLGRRSMLSLYLELTKARLSALVLLTTAAGFVLASLQAIDWLQLLWTLTGTALAAGCANALNQAMEVQRDARMHRTRNRPLPSGALHIRSSVIAALLMGYAGVAMLALLVNQLAAALALITIVLYVLVYTPLKSRTTLNTLVGAVCGAIPPMIGWAGATGSLHTGAWALGAILFVWQLPHFFALAWLYRDDYERGGYAMLPVIDRGGRLTCQVVVLTALLLLPLGLLATLLSVAGYAYAVGSLALGLWMLALCVRLYRQRSDANARSVFFASIIYLPLLLCLAVIDRGPVSGSAAADIARPLVAFVAGEAHEAAVVTQEKAANWNRR